LALKAKHEAEKFNFERKLKDLQDKLKEKDENELEKSKSKEVHHNTSKNKITAGATQFSNPADLLKLRL
jgi:hypothetical protein